MRVKKIFNDIFNVQMQQELLYNYFIYLCDTYKIDPKSRLYSTKDRRIPAKFRNCTFLRNDPCSNLNIRVKDGIYITKRFYEPSYNVITLCVNKTPTYVISKGLTCDIELTDVENVYKYITESEFERALLEIYEYMKEYNNNAYIHYSNVFDAKSRRNSKLFAF